MSRYWGVTVGVCVAVAAFCAGCSHHPVFHIQASAASSTETITTDSTGSGRNCVAAVTVQEAANGRTHSVQQAGVPCGRLSMVEARMEAAAKKGL